MKWIALLPLALALSACGNVYTSEVVAYRTVEMAPVPPEFVVVDEAPVSVTTTETIYY